MKHVNFDYFKGRCSQISAITAESSDNPKLTEKQLEKMKELDSKENLTEKQKDELALLKLKDENSKIVTLSTTYIGYLMDEYAFITEGMIGIDKDFESLQMQNGTLVEHDSLVSLIQATGKPYMPNINEEGEQDRVFNDYLSGKPDAYLGNSLMEAEEIPDIKSSFDYPTFLKKIHTKLSKANTQQVQGYLDITGAKVGFIADCLSNTHQTVIDGLKWKLLKKLEGIAVSEESLEFIKQWQIIEKSTSFSHLSANLKVNIKYVEPFSEYEKQFVYDQVKRGRDFLNNFYEQRKKLI
jgi:hypothetical protein